MYKFTQCYIKVSVLK